MLTGPFVDVMFPEPVKAPESVIAMLPELLTAALKATFPPVVVKVKALVGVELEIAWLTVIAAVLLSVAEPAPSLV